MTYYQSNKKTLGMAIEPSRGTPSQPQYRFIRKDYDFGPKMEVKDNDGSVGSLVATTDSMVAREWSEGNIGGSIYPNGIGALLLSALGKVDSETSGTNPVHTFTTEDVNDHPTLTIATHDPVADFLYPNTIVHSLQVSAEAGGDLIMTAGLKGRKGVVSSEALVPSFTEEKAFKTTDMKVIYADDLGGLSSSSNICVQSISISIRKITQDIDCLSSIDPVDYANKSIVIEGSLEMYWTDNTYRDIAFNSIAKAMRLQIIDKSVDLSGEHPELTIDLPRIKITDWTDAVSLGEIVKQSISFRAHYSISDSKAIEVLLRNTQASY